ncbi:MAG: hypothetical protein KatS3mg047_1503 [Bellilinea sp.]|nr:MAG: hypothetical protein KatS3mg047_1503 [Bellilinea sp.]
MSKAFVTAFGFRADGGAHPAGERGDERRTLAGAGHRNRMAGRVSFDQYARSAGGTDAVVDGDQDPDPQTDFDPHTTPTEKVR